MNKNLKDLSWQVSEEEYRKDPAYSYSTLARFAREGFDGLPHLFDKIESPSLTFGSCVDAIITGGDDEFDSRFMVAEMSNEPSDVQKQISEVLFRKYNETYASLPEIPDSEMISAIEGIQWNNHWLPGTRCKKIKEDCTGYYALMFEADNKTIISTRLYNQVMECVNALRSSTATRFYFEQDNAFDDNIQRFYQLKFKARILGIDFRCMPDEIIVIHDKKLVVPVDLKTSSKPEWEFPKSFMQWKYYLQANLYTRILRLVLDQDEYFKDFKIASYKFIVVNRNTLTPLVWNFSDAVINVNAQMEDPVVLAVDLDRYLKEKPKVPHGISLDKPNDLDKVLNEL